MAKPRIRHIAINVQDREKTAEYYKRIFGMEEKYRGPGGTIYLSDGHISPDPHRQVSLGNQSLRLSGGQRQGNRGSRSDDCGSEYLRRRGGKLDSRR